MKIAIEDKLTGIRNLLQENGYEVLRLPEHRDADVVVVTGIDNNVLNMQDINTKVPVVNASGKTPEEILGYLNYLKRKELGH